VSRTLIIAIGNTLRGDDGVAQRVVEELSDCDQAADIESVIQLTVELAPKLAEYETVLFVDASVLLRPGQWVLEKLDDSTKFESCIGHHFCPQELLNLAATLYDANPRAYMLSIGAKQFDHAESLSEEVTAQLGAVAMTIREWLRKLSTTIDTLYKS
jgi:hydrogenase maturation protease